jgi:hypothetical protein
MSKELTVYWAPVLTHSFKDVEDLSFLYPKPETLFKNLSVNKIQTESNSSYFRCPAVANKMKHTLVFKSPMDFSYSYDFSNGKSEVTQTSNVAIGTDILRDQQLTIGPNIAVHLEWIFFAEEEVEAFFTSPYFHEPKYTKSGSAVPAEFNIGTWFRPYVMELQTWNNVGELKFENNEPLFYVELKTDKKINLKRFEYNEKLHGYAKACMNSTFHFGTNQGLLSRYNRFKDIGMREKILTEIKKNLIDE